MAILMLVEILHNKNVVAILVSRRYIQLYNLFDFIPTLGMVY